MPVNIYTAFGEYGTQTDFYFATDDPADADDLYIGTAFAADDAKISKDGGAVASTTNVPAQITASQPHYKLTLTASEMSASRILVTIRDQTATEVFGPIVLDITTRLKLGTLSCDASNIAGNTSAIIAKGVGIGDGIRATGGGGSGAYGIQAVAATSTNNSGFVATGQGTGDGITLTGGATGAGLKATGSYGGYFVATSAAGIQATGTTDGISATAGTNGNGLILAGDGTGSGLKATAGATGHGIYGVGGATSGHGVHGTATTSGSGITGTGIGAGHGFNGVAGASGKIANFFDTIMGTEPSTPYAATDSFGTTITRLAMRFYNKVTQTASQQKVYQGDSSTVVDTMTVSDAGSTVTKGKSA